MCRCWYPQINHEYQNKTFISWFIVQEEKLYIVPWAIYFTLYKALLVSIGADWIHLSITAGRGVVKSLLQISGLKKTCITSQTNHQDAYGTIPWRGKFTDRILSSIHPTRLICFSDMSHIRHFNTINYIFIDNLINYWFSVILS